MMLTVLRVIYGIICAGAVFAIVQASESDSFLSEYPGAQKFVRSHKEATFVLLMLATQVLTVIDIIFPRKRIDVISAVYFGALVGWLLSYLLYSAVVTFLVAARFPPELANVPAVLLGIMMPYLCISFLLQTKDDFRFIIPYVEFAKEVKGGRPIIVDTSSLIDGRISDFMDTNVLDNELVIPNFVLEELQSIADSNDKMRRVRGRRGLEVLTKLQQNPKVEVRLLDARDKELSEMTVDLRLVALAKRMTGRIITNDFNLNKVAGVQGVDVINLNDVSNSLKPRYLPGELLRLKIIREGEGIAQGVGYLDDGTMVVVEQASSMVGKEIDVAVTSMLQNSSGRMIFGRMPGAMVGSGR